MRNTSRTPKSARASASAEDIATLIRQSTSALPSLENVTVKLVRLPRPDADGCNWVAKPSPLPGDHPPGAPGILYGAIADARRQFNLSEAP